MFAQTYTPTDTIEKDVYPFTHTHTSGIIYVLQFNIFPNTENATSSNYFGI